MSGDLQFNKKCIKCNIDKPIERFEQSFDKKRGKQYTRNVCKTCRVEQRRKKTRNISITEKECRDCLQLKNIEQFTKLQAASDGYNYRCKDCYKIYRKKDRKGVKKTKTISNKFCSKCLFNKSVDNFRTTLQSSDGYQSICNECWPISTWNIDKRRESNKKYYYNNRDKMRKKWNNRYNNNINYRLSNNVNKQLRENLSKVGRTKNDRTIKYIGCSLNFFRSWLEYNFDNDISWDNYTEWHLDHVKPGAAFNFNEDDQVNKCFHWSNYQPLLAKNNQEKSDKIDWKYIMKHYMKAIIFEISALPSLNSDVSSGPS